MANFEQLMRYLDKTAQNIVESPTTRQLPSPEDYIQLLTSLMGRSVVQKRSIVADDPKYRFLLNEMDKLQYLPES